MASKITQVKKVFSKARNHTVEYLYKDQYKVKSCTSGRFYVVSANLNRCTCDRQTFTKRGTPNACSHVQAVFKYRQSQYQLVARQDTENVGHLHRKEFNELSTDGVRFTGRKI